MPRRKNNLVGDREQEQKQEILASGVDRYMLVHHPHNLTHLVGSGQEDDLVLCSVCKCPSQQCRPQE